MDIGGWYIARKVPYLESRGVCIATAAGARVKSALKDMSDSLFFWGVARIYQYGLGVAATDWDEVSEKRKPP